MVFCQPQLDIHMTCMQPKFGKRNQAVKNSMQFLAESLGRTFGHPILEIRKLDLPAGHLLILKAAPTAVSLCMLIFFYTDPITTSPLRKRTMKTRERQNTTNHSHDFSLALASLLHGCIQFDTWQAGECGGEAWGG